MSKHLFVVLENVSVVDVHENLQHYALVSADSLEAVTRPLNAALRRSALEMDAMRALFSDRWFYAHVEVGLDPVAVRDYFEYETDAISFLEANAAAVRETRYYQSLMLVLGRSPTMEEFLEDIEDGFSGGVAFEIDLPPGDGEMECLMHLSGHGSRHLVFSKTDKQFALLD